MKFGKPLRAAACAALARAELLSGDRVRAREHASAAIALLEELGAIEEFETLVRLADAETAQAAGASNAAVVITLAKARLARIAATMDAARRDSFLTRVPENVATLALV